MHKKHQKKFLNILLIPDDDSAPRNLRIRYATLRFLLILAIFLFVSILAGVVTYGKVLRLALERNTLARENAQLREQLMKVNEILSELESLKAYQQKLRHTLEGYINLEKAMQESGETESISTLQARLSSIFTSLPLKAPITGFISQEYSPPTHYGVDIVAAEGTPIQAAADGIVLFSGWTYHDGNVLILQHDRGYFTYYKHNLRNLVFPHQIVKQGQVIALLGNSGESSGPHLHFEIWRGGFPIDPLKLVMNLD
ncbi:MAG: peptidoglycan DD-metalloendopeptidase family protein [Calditrichaeota bacterium]|nr:peptidoglycan DD-metalloendopeptidase family protein [Calditrichota bacterium]